MHKIGFLYTSGRKERLGDIKIGQSPADFFYGALELEKRDYSIDLISEAEIPCPWLARMISPLGAVIYDYLGVIPALTLRLAQKEVRQRLNKLDYLVATTNSYGSALAFLKLLGLIKAKIIFLSMAYILPKQNLLNKKIRKKLLKQTILALENKNEISLLNKELKQSQKIFYLPFGVDESFWRPGEQNQNYVLSVGNDTRRDFWTLIKAWKPEYPLLKIVTQLPLPEKLPGNVERWKGSWKEQLLTDEKMRELYQSCRFTIISVKKGTHRASGESVFMQTTACGRPVIISETDGLWDKELLKHREAVLLVQPGSVEDLQKNIENLLNDQVLYQKLRSRSRQVFAENYTIKILADRLENIIRSS